MPAPASTRPSCRFGICATEAALRILGIDYGEKRVGFAVCDPGGIIAVPLCMVEVKDDDDALKHAARIAIEQQIECIVVGLPINMNGTKGPMAVKVQAFADRLKVGAPWKVETCDERLTTSAVERSLIASDMSRAKRKLVRDKMAAQLILQSYLDRQQASVDNEEMN